MKKKNFKEQSIWLYETTMDRHIDTCRVGIQLESKVIHTIIKLVDYKKSRFSMLNIKWYELCKNYLKFYLVKIKD